MPKPTAPKSYKAIAEYYDPEYEHLEYLRRDVPFLMSRIGKRRKSVLEIAVGTGRAAIPLAQAGHRVVGIDNDPGVLAVAKRKREFVGVKDSALRLVRGDARTFRLTERFDWCAILFNTLLAFPQVEDLDAVLENAHRHLKRGGRIMIDIFNPDLSLLAEGQSWGLDPVTFYVPALDRTVSRVTDLEDISPQVRRVTFNYRWFEFGEERREQVAFELSWMMPRELLLFLERHGFEVEDTFGDHDGSEITQTSPRIVAIAKKG